MSSTMNKKQIVVFVAVLACLSLLGCSQRHKEHDYLVLVQTQTEPAKGSLTRQLIVSGTKFTVSDLNKVRADVAGGYTNMAVVVLNIIKLDN